MTTMNTPHHFCSRSRIAHFLRDRNMKSLRVLLSAVVAVAMAFGFSPSTARGQGSCAGDNNGDGLVNHVDLATVLNSWGACPGCTGDMNGDGVVNPLDLAMVMSGWGVCPSTVTSVTPLQGSILGGTQITINGTNLGGATSVTIGGVPATNVVAVSSTTVTAVTPAGSVGAVDVTVSGPKNTATAANAFTYTSTWYTVLEQNPNPAVVTDVTLRNAITATGYPWRVRDNGTQIEMVLVPGETFTMGCTASNGHACNANENPTHSVTITNAFYMGRYEVTQAQWLAKMGSNPSYFQGASYPDAASRPVEQVSWNTIQGFLTATGMQLPTEAQWEYACRAGTTTAFHGFTGFPSGTNADTLVGNIAWYTSNAGSQTHAVGGKAANGLGLHDMGGNVWEWCGDWIAAYVAGAQTNPTGPATGTSRVLRGGAGNNTSDSVRSSNRSGLTPDVTFNVIGFRVARSPS